MLEKSSGILLIHGLLSSPEGMSSLREYFEKQGYIVHSLLLPGHGTCPEDLQNVTYLDWLDACRKGIQILREKVSYVTVVAFSASTTMALYLALTENTIDSLVLIAPALALTNPLCPIVPFLYSIRHWCTKINWPVIKKEDDWAKYQSIPINAIYQITQLMKQVNYLLKLKALSIPVYMVSTEDDETISHQKALKFFASQANPLNGGIIYAHQKPKNLPASLVYRTSVYPDEKILDFSHPALAISPAHPHYGRDGDYADFAHYSEANINTNKDVYQGALSRQNLRKYYMKRLSYNPDFEYLTSGIAAFLQCCQQVSSK